MTVSQRLRAWRSIALAFLVLGLNKQLDLQTALTEAGRVLANVQGWYDQRQIVQVAFIAVDHLLGRCGRSGEVGARGPSFHLVGAYRLDYGDLLRIDPCCVVPSYRPFYRRESPRLSLELDPGDGRY
jgi:hypothetical protein